MRTQRLARLELNPKRISDELDLSSHFEFAEQYGEFQCGRPWKACMLWSRGGVVGDGVIAHYDLSRPAMPTLFGQQLPYLRSVIERHFSVEQLLFVRMAVMSYVVLVPHRDFLEFDDRPAEQRAKHRLHIPLATSERCLFMEENVVYRMPVGEAWSIDVTKMHSSAVLDETRRVHLILDFAEADGDMGILNFAAEPSGEIPACSRVDRPLLPDQERAAIRTLAGVIDHENLTEVFGMLIRKHYRKDGGTRYPWDAMEELARLSGNTRLHQEVSDLYKHCMLERYE